MGQLWEVVQSIFKLHNYSNFRMWDLVQLVENSGNPFHKPFQSPYFKVKAMVAPISPSPNTAMLSIASEISFFSWLVVWNMFFFFHSVGNFIIPTDDLIFFRGVGQPPTSIIFQCCFKSKFWGGKTSFCLVKTTISVVSTHPPKRWPQQSSEAAVMGLDTFFRRAAGSWKKLL